MKHNTNKNKNLNKVVTKFLPKDTYLCQTIRAKARIYAAISIDNVGQEEFYSRLYEKLGMDYDNSFIKH